MSRPLPHPRLIAVAFAFATSAFFSAPLQAEDQPGMSLQVRGRPISHWVAQAAAENGPDDPAQTVDALIEALKNDDPNVKQTAADALAVLGPKALAALPALLEQFGHEFPWVRESCQAAAGAMGKAAVPALIDLFEKNPGGPRIRAAFVLGGIGEDARAAIPTLLKVIEEESDVMAERIRGVLGQIDPEKYGPRGAAGKAGYDAAAAQAASVKATGDWAQFHGPGRDAICREEGLLQEWPEGGPRHLWTLNGLGRGYSTIAIAGDRFYTMGDRAGAAADAGETQYVIACDLQTRKELWAAPVGPPHDDGGPRCTPTADGGSVYAIGTAGNLVCLDAGSGKLRWQVDLAKTFDGAVMAVWKYSESVLIDGDKAICTPGGPEAIMAAFHKQTGELLWKSALPADIGAGGADGAGYSSAVVAEIDGVRQYVQLVGRGLIGVNAETGEFLWGYNRIANTVANITHPIVRGDYVFTTTAYNTGAALLKISRDGDAWKAEEVYFIAPKDFQNHHGGVVLVGEHIYGGHGSNRGDPACVEFGTGKVVWKERSPSRGSAAILYADGNLIYRYDRGEVLLIEATPEGMNIKGRFEPAKGDGPAWAHPVIHRGRLYLRHADLLGCYDLHR